MKKATISEIAEPTGAATQTKPNRSQNLLACVSQRLLTGTGLTTSNFPNMNTPTELLTVRATMLTGFVSDNPGYSHYGIND